MRVNFSLNMTQEQKLVMTQQMQLSVKLLQMSAYELQKYVINELEENPLLESNDDEKNGESKSKDEIDYKEFIKHLESDGYDSKVSGFEAYDKDEEYISPLNFVSSEKSLKEYLNDQIRDLDIDKHTKNICNYIIENIDDRGYLDNTVENIAKELNLKKSVVEDALKIVQSLEPDGIGARNLQECLKIQIHKIGKKDKKLFDIIDNYLEYLAENKYKFIAKELNITPKKVQDYADFIRTLEPKPSRGYYTGEEIKYLVPDAYIKKVGSEFIIIMNDNSIPNITINQLYKNILMNENDKDTVDYVKNKFNSAVFLLKSIGSRESTVYKILNEILKIQKDYFEYGEEYLKPMTLKEIADNLDMHESTISRGIKDKYISTNRGIIKIKDLFTTGVSSNISNEDVSANVVKKNIKEIIENEDKSKPVSDQRISDMLKKSGINIARRTVAKYRESLGIKSSSARKRL